MPRSVIERRFLNRMEDLGRAGLDAARFLEAAGIGGQPAYTAELAIEEFGTNIIKYGYDDPRGHEILLQVEIEPGAIRVLLEDDGNAFNPLDVPEPNLHFEQSSPGGLGIHLVRKLAHRIQYERRDGHNRITVEIKSAPQS